MRLQVSCRSPRRPSSAGIADDDRRVYESGDGRFFAQLGAAIASKAVRAAELPGKVVRQDPPHRTP